MGIQDIIAIAVAAAALAFLLRILWRNVNGKAGCSCGSASGESACPASVNRTGLKQTPLVPLNQPQVRPTDDTTA